VIGKAMRASVGKALRDVADDLYNPQRIEATRIMTARDVAMVLVAIARKIEGKP
jgi:hypothetical protein